MKRNYIVLFLVICLGTSCSTTRNTNSNNNGKIDITFIQVNDVYEIAPLEGGRSGGFARIAYLKNKYLAINPNTYLVMAGDFLSPSVYNSLQFEGKRIRGRQMIETMNVAGTDLVVFGNHEFDITESELQSRINESSFQWVSSNSFQKKENGISRFVKSNGNISEPLPETYIMTVTDTDGTIAKIGFMGITLPFNKASYVSYTDPLETAEKMYNRIKDSCDAIVALTHQLIADDILLARRLPGLAMIIGGHEHDEQFKKVGNVIISKAHANAKSAYILHLKLNKRKQAFKVKSELIMIDETIPLEPKTDSIVNKWTGIAEKNYSSIGFDAKKIIRTAGEPLEGRESEIRFHPTNFSRIIVAGMEAATPKSDVVIVNAGSIRLDDVLQMPVSQYDILRSMPFGGGISETEMKGALIIKTLEAGRKNVGIGGFLHYSSSLSYITSTGVWQLKEKPIDPAKIYKVALPEFLLTGGEANMDFLKKDNPDIVHVYPFKNDQADPRSDIRLAVIRYMESQPASKY